MSVLTKRILLGVAAVLVIIQFFGIDKTNPPVEASQDFLSIANPPAEIASLIKSSCYDCHSHQTKYPWYTNVAPVSWMIGHHIEEGREHLNFSKWGTYPAKKRAHKIEECYEEVEEGEMPMKGYVILHSEAKMSKEQKEQLIAWFKQREQQEI
ncbi:MAG: heme-binding domain-containing protein [Saprospiraceae bacterium]|nr:heme-binding domain-containing protein [Saprospiraceae bacterium]